MITIDPNEPIKALSWKQPYRGLDYVAVEISDAYIHEHIIPRMRECEGLFSKLKIV